jgi:eukaryotic-like serine/threonine-protein kinase
MKPKHLKVILSILLLGILLTACSGVSATNSWAGLTASDTAVYFTNSSSIVAVKTDNGNAIWTYPVQATSKGLFSSSPAARYFSAAPAVVGEQLIVGDYTGLLVSLSTRDGKEMWQFTGAKGRYIDAPLIVNDTIIAQNADGTIHALDLNGNVLWTFTGEHAFWATPVSDGKTVFATSMDHFLYALNLSDGTLKWKTDLSDPLVGRPLLTADGTLYVGTLNNTLYSVKAEDGSVNWKQTLKSAVWATPVMIQDRLYIGDQAGNIYLIKAADGSLIQTIEIGSAILGNGVVVGDKLAFGDEKGEVILIGINGERAWTRSLTGKIYSNLVFSGDHLYVLTTKGDQPLHAFDANGNEIWNYSTSK